MNYKFQNKKAMSFFILGPLVLIIFLVFVNLYYIFPNDRIVDELSSSKTIQNLDNLLQKKRSQDFYLESILDSTLYTSKIDFPKYYFNNNGEKICFEKDLILFIDEREDSFKCAIYFENVSEEYLEFFKERFKTQYIETEQLDIDIFNSFFRYDNNNLLIEIDTQSTKSSDISQIESEHKKLRTHNVGDYFIFIESLEENLYVLKELLKTQLRICEDENNDLIIENSFYCKEKIVSDYFKTIPEYSSLNFRISNFDIGESKFYGITIGVAQKNVSNKFMEFGLIFRNPPLDYPTFSLKQFEYANNVLEVLIEQKEDEIEQYIILYSYDNFFDEDVYENYGDLIESFEFSEKGIPLGFESVGITDQDGAIKYYKSDDPFEINMLILNKNEEDLRKIKLYQSYDFVLDDGSYLEFESDKEIFVFVFALDSSFEYLINSEKMLKKIKSEETTYKYGPDPLVFKSSPGVLNNLVVEDEIFERQNSIEVVFQGDIDSRIVAFEVYFTQNQDSNLLPKCLNANYFCSFKQIPFTGFEDLDQKKYLITSEDVSSLEQISEYDGILDTNSFSKSFVLENGVSYNLIIIPIDSNGVGVYKNIQKEYNIIKNQNRYVLSNQGVIKLDVESIQINTKDMKKPHPINSVTIDSQISSSGVLTIQDNPNDLEEITGLRTYWSEENKYILIPFLTGQITNFDPLKPYTLTKIFPIDKYGNYFDEDTYFQPTQQASYNP